MNSSITEGRVGRRRSRQLAGRLALALCAATAGSNSGSAGGGSSHCSEMTSRIIPTVAAFVPPSPSSSNAVSPNHRVGGRAAANRRKVVPLVLKDPTQAGTVDQTTHAENTNSAGPDNSAAAFSSNSGTSTGPLLLHTEERERLNQEFTNDLLLNSGIATGSEILNSAAPAALEEILDDGGGDRALAEQEAAERAFLETVVKEGDNNIVRVEGIPGLSGSGDSDLILASFETEESGHSKQSSTSTSTGTTTSSTPYQIPTLSQIVRFALPATAIYLCDPLLSLIDTAAVGLLAKSTAHQAALSPAIAVVNYSALLLAFLFVGATNFVAQAAARGASTPHGGLVDMDEKSEHNSLARILLSTLQISLHTGTLLGVVLFALAPALITLLTGGRGSLPPEVFGPAVQYVRIRALGFPAAAVLGSAQSACLGLKDTTTPLLVLGAAAILNVVGDMSLVGMAGNRWLFGAAGAAWATVVGQTAAVALFLKLLKAKPKVKKGDDTVEAAAAATKVGGRSGRLSLTRLFSRDRRSSLEVGDVAVDLPAGNDDSDGSDDGGAISARGFLAEYNFEPHHILRLPPKSTVRQFLPYVVPVTTTSVGRVSLFLSMAHVVSSCMGVVGMAAQTIALGIFDALCPLSQSLTLAAQAFVPGALEEQDRLRRAAGQEAEATGRPREKSPDVLAQFSRQFLKAGAAFGLFTTLLATATPFLSGLMTTNAAVVSQIAAVMPQLAAIFALHGLVMSAEGVLLGKEDVNYLGWMYGAFFFIMPAWMMRVKHGALNLGKTVGLDSVWGIFLVYQLMRSVLWAGRAAMPTKDR